MRKHKALNRPLKIAVIAVSVIVALLVLAIWIAARAGLAAVELDEAQSEVAAVQTAFADGGDTEALERSLITVADHVSAAAGHVSDPVYRLGELVPVVGPNLTALREISQNLDAVLQPAQDALPRISGVLDSLRDAGDSGLPLEELAGLEPALADLEDASTTANEAFSRIDDSALLDPLQQAVAKIREPVTALAEGMTAAHLLSELLPTTLGADGPRTIVVAFQNNAELRAQGGMTGAFASLHADDGVISLADQASATEYGRAAEPYLELEPDTQNLYSTRMSRYLHDVAFTPHFPQSAEVVRAAWARNKGEEPTTVISLDTAALSYLLEATGPVVLASGDTITADNAVKFLLSDVYARYDTQTEQDGVFQSAAQSVFSALIGNKADPIALVTAFGRAATEERILLWSADPAEQQVISDLGIDEHVPSAAVESSEYGVYLNDATSSKLGYYLAAGVSGASESCGTGSKARIDTRLAYSAPSDAAVSLAPSVTGGSGSQASALGNLRLQLNVYAPDDAVLTSVRLDGVDLPYFSAYDGDNFVTQIIVELSPEQVADISIEFDRRHSSTDSVSIEHTPFLNETEIEAVAPVCN